MIKRFMFLICAFALAFSISIASATISFNRVYLNDSDNFYSNYSGNDVIHVLVNVTNTSTIISFYANFTNLTTSCGDSGIVNLSYIGNGIWNASCNVGNQATISDFVGGGISLVAINLTGSLTVDNSLRAVLYNITTPVMPQGCQRFGYLTTNFTSVSDFARVNFIIHIQNNFTCMVGQMGISGPPSLSKEYLDVMIMNLTSVNLSTPEQAQKLSNLPSYLTLNISPPKVFPNIAKIFVNSTGFAALDTNASIKLLNLPFVSIPNVSAEEPNELIDVSWVSNGFDNGFQIITGNLTINVGGFSGYNATDVVKPNITIISPTNSYINTTNFVLNISANGTGTELSKLTINITNSSGQVNFTIYNASVNSANCANTSLGGDFYYCSLTITLSAGSYTINVTAWDYGGESPGNTKNLAQALTIDTTAPVLTSIDEDPSTTSATISYSASEDVNVTVKYGTSAGSLVYNKTVSDYDNSDSFSITGLTADETYYYNITICDRANNCVTNGTYSFTTDEEEEEDGDSSSTSGGGDFWIITYPITDSQFKNGTTKLLKKGYRMKVIIGGAYHYVGIVKLTSSKATINVSSTPQQAELEEGESAKFDVTGDRYYDILVTLNAVNSIAANISIKYINELMPSTTTLSTNATSNATIMTIEETGEKGAEQEEGIPLYKNKIFWAIIGVVVIAAAIFGYQYRKKIRKKLGYE
ncbi:MAG: fibronectin type III domain-containing protein [Candidatus Pacearchaeota archaeon]